MRITGRVVGRVIAQLLAVVLLAGALLTGGAAEAATRPSAPRAAKATPLDHAVRITWQAPASTGGSRIDRYDVQRWNPSTQRWRSVRSAGPRVRSWTNTGLVNGTPYYFRVLAHNARGWSPASRQVSATPRGVPGGVPSPEVDTYDAELRARWGKAAANGAAAVDHYAIQISTDSVTWTGTQKVTTQAAAYPNLVPGTRYWFRVSAHNVAGYGPFSGAGPYRAWTVPSAVEDLEVTAGDGEADLDWTAPAQSSATGHSAPADYLVEQSADGGTTWSVLGSTADTSFNAPGLINGGTYLFRVSARSSLSNLGYNTPVMISTDPAIGTPAAPRNAAVVWDDDAGEFVLAWDAPTSNGGSALDHYDVAVDEQATPDTVPSGQTTTPVADGTISHVVRACNTLGFCSAWATAPALPGQPSDLTGTPVMAGAQWQVTLGWTAPSSGADVASYRLERKVTSDLTWTVLASDLTDPDYVDTTAAPETDYDYRVVAVGVGGVEGQPSGVATAATGVAQALSFSPDPVEVVVGAQGQFDVVLAVASSVDVEIALTSLDPSVATVGATVTIPAGQTHGTVTFNGVAIGQTTITAALSPAPSPAVTLDVPVQVNDLPVPD